MLQRFERLQRFIVAARMIQQIDVNDLPGFVQLHGRAEISQSLRRAGLDLRLLFGEFFSSRLRFLFRRQCLRPSDRHDSHRCNGRRRIAPATDKQQAQSQCERNCPKLRFAREFHCDSPLECGDSSPLSLPLCVLVSSVESRLPDFAAKAKKAGMNSRTPKIA